MSRESCSAVSMIGVEKRFGGNRALKGVNFTVEAGTIHALMGENGAGKSTLLKILQGVYKPDAGTVEIFGEPMQHFNPAGARALGVGMIFQDLSLVSSLTVAQNMFLTREPRHAGWLVDDRSANREAQRLLNELGLDIDPRSPVSSLSSGQAQMTEIAKVISQDARVLILDEPTSALSTSEVQKLFEFLKRLAAKGVAVIYVSHRMEEIAEIAQFVTVMRDGSHVMTAPLGEITVDQIIEKMVGSRVHNFRWIPKQQFENPEPLLELRGVSGRSKPVDVSFTLHRGEVIGIAGLLGSGRTEIARVLFGIDEMTRGEIVVRGKPVKIKSPVDAIRAGMALVPESRAEEGLVGSHSVASNLSVTVLDDLCSAGFVDSRKEAGVARRLVDRLRIKTAGIRIPVRALSGGNQQKVVIGKWLATNPDIIIFDEPTAGIDIGSKAEIVEEIRKLSSQGKGVIVISSELAELLAVSDRLLLVRRGRVMREITRDEIDRWSSSDSGNEMQELATAERCLQAAIQEVGNHA
ncbi:sugar ABC transporter ATP-binding protein [Paraburkholderia phenoliruptrix]|uniref:sugar ABC transporter ATP-binding protein n=1 Tax=Paraburkholderia phenoliruptrix TaxID=252970 RepID=UPI00286986D7|nr:sugar ABC transporter ATP-binding protein [Paraburkholderia phenoliruptrix]WMY11781.1 sugar ABC transporter ATP-binding protein [Paraburkholderia phenoliruptrix]